MLDIVAEPQMFLGIILGRHLGLTGDRQTHYIEDKFEKIHL